MKRFILFAIIQLFFINSFSQNVSDSIVMLKTKRENKFYQNNKEIKFVKLLKIMKSNKVAYRYIKYANTNRFFSNLMVGYAVIGLGYSVSRMVETGRLSFLLAGAIVAGTYVLFSIPFNKGFVKNVRNAIRFYNKGLSKSAANNLILKFQTTTNGIGFVMNF